MDSELPLEQRRQIDRLADRFETEYRAGQQPKIEDYINRHPQLRPHLLRELVAMELGLMLTDGKPPKAQEYHRRFPAYQDLIDDLFLTHHDPDITIEQGLDAEKQEDDLTPQNLGRYKIIRLLGEGGFGVVYLAQDPELDGADLALKVPKRRHFNTAEQVTRFIDEARTAARLNHPGLVAVYDVQQHEEIPYIVQEYIAGQHLGNWARQLSPSYEQISRVLLDVAEALGYLHQQGLTHCDLKLANVLMDEVGHAHVADFGLAVREAAQDLYRNRRFGTRATMAPEQVRGESHRLDGRTDIWSMGVMLYQLLVGRTPFKSTGEDLYEDILTLDPKPPRQVDGKVPKELERICLKCLSKRRTDRYNTTVDLREDLLAWLTGSERDGFINETDPVGTRQGALPAGEPAQVIPKGLRSFDKDDADFFLDLLPGPRDRNGLPESIRFWKTRIEETDPDETFAVGLIYGPSGCGKSSLIKAGLLPRLADHVDSLYVEATAEDTSLLLLKQLRKHCPRLPEGATLAECCAQLRRTGAGCGKKILLVIDQFEQWLHSNAGLEDSSLVDGLRQCDGGNLQALLLVRDDFYLSVNRVFQELEVRLVEGRNQAVFDLFDLDHAKKILVAFGRAFGKLREDLTVEQEQFVSHTVSELAEDQKVICVRLALLADMVKTRPWLLASLAEVGGVGGLGVTFLEETFSARTAPPSHRAHEKAIRGVLAALLPEAGTDIKGATRTSSDLRNAAGYEGQPEKFKELMRILDGEARLITPIDPASDDSLPQHTRENSYQLTHDYLVPSLREWLTRKQRATRKGRAELLLSERSVSWNNMRQDRYLPNWREHFLINVFTPSSQRTDSQRRMMRRAGVVHARKTAAVMAVLIAFAAFAVWQISHYRRSRTEDLVHSLLTAEPEKLPDAIDNVRPMQRLAVPLLLECHDDEERPVGERLHAAIALSHLGSAEPKRIVSLIAGAHDAECHNIVMALLKTVEESTELLRDEALALSSEKEWDYKARLAIVALHLEDESIAAAMVETKADYDPIQRSVFIDSFARWHGAPESLTALAETKSGSLRSGVCLAVGGVATDGDKVSKELESMLKHWYLGQFDSGTHSAAEWAMKNLDLTLPNVPPNDPPTSEDSWFHDRFGHTFAVVQISQDGASAVQHLAVATKEETVEQVTKYGPTLFDVEDQSSDGQIPVRRVALNDVMAYCNVLSKKAEIPGEQWCYVESDDHTYVPKSEFQRLTGYRLPTYKEWRSVCRAGTTTRRYFGDSDDFMDQYVWYLGNTKSAKAGRATSTEPVGPV